ncbi:MAG: bifunctional hydroxymethylpyrimidine kinase/phosphomethylpyrimidine kinase [Chloroflexota bacterium]
MKTYKRTLTIAGSDSGGGAGIQADLKTFSALGCFGMSVLTAITAQNTVAVTAIHPIPIDVIGAQIDAVLNDLGADAIKIGMLHSPEVIAVVAERLAHHGVKNIVLDPVMVAKSGDKLLLDDAVDALKAELLPMATVITPNLPEASVFLGRSLEGRQTDGQMEEACRDLAGMGAQAVLLKGGHAEGEVSRDLLYITADQAFHAFEAKRIDTPNLHGTGCTLSSAIAALLAQGLEIKAAVAEAKRYISDAIVAGAEYTIGQGHGPVHHFYRSWS